MISPLAPHIAEELWNRLGHSSSLAREPFPVVTDESLLVEEEITAVVQINGKVKEKMSVASGLGRDELQKTVMESEAAVRAVDGRNIVKVIAVPDKLVNIVVK